MHYAIWLFETHLLQAERQTLSLHIFHLCAKSYYMVICQKLATMEVGEKRREKKERKGRARM